MFWSFRLIDIHKDQFYVRRIFGDDLSAGTTWGGATLCGDSHFLNVWWPVVRALKMATRSAQQQTIAGTLNVGVNDRVSIGQERSADLEFEYGACACSRAFMASEMMLVGLFITSGEFGE